MHVDQMFPSKYIKHGDLQGRDVTVTIERVAGETVRNQDGDKRVWVAYFRGANKGLILNKTTATTIAALYGPESDGWIGKAVTLYGTNVRAFGQTHQVVRIRSQRPSQTAASPGDGDAVNDAEDVTDAEDAAGEVDADASQPDDDPDPTLWRRNDEPWRMWAGPDDAYVWAIGSGACKDEPHARMSLRKILERDFDGKFTNVNRETVFATFYSDRIAKLSETQVKEAA